MEHKRNFFSAFLWTVGIAVACLVSISDIPSVSVIGKDKAVHSFFYFVFSILWFLFLTKERSQWSFDRKAIIIFLSAFLYGCFIEACQEIFTETRTADINDVFANISGGILGIMVLLIIEKFRKRRLLKK